MKEEELRYLDYLQNNISRMSTSSFQMKGWCITLVAALLAVYATTVDCSENHNGMLLLIAVIPILAFWILDTYYLMQERDLRIVYNIVAGISRQEEDIKTFDLRPKLKKRASFVKTLFSKTEHLFYFMIGALVLLFQIACN